MDHFAHWKEHLQDDLRQTNIKLKDEEGKEQREMYFFYDATCHTLERSIRILEFIRQEIAPKLDELEKLREENRGMRAELDKINHPSNWSTQNDSEETFGSTYLP